MDKQHMCYKQPLKTEYKCLFEKMFLSSKWFTNPCQVNTNHKSTTTDLVLISKFPSERDRNKDASFTYTHKEFFARLFLFSNTPINLPKKL